MDISKNFEHRTAETYWYAAWEQQGYFTSTPDNRPPYTITMPPPNVTGILHMGHALNNSVQDILIRRAKMEGYNTCWVPGTDHASIATEAKVVNHLKELGIEKNSLDRATFLKHAWDWKEKYGGIILQQLRKMGCSLDWNRTAFTMDTDYYAAVIRVFVVLYNKGYIYRGAKMINWDPKAQTALSDEEVYHKTTQSKLVYVRYKIDAPGAEYITVATVRPETILGDTAVCVHPEDERYAHLKGCFCYVPIINRRVPIVFDEYIDREFGTGALKVTPAHDINDYNLGLKHNLAVIDTLNADGTMSAEAGIYAGKDRFEVRKQIIADLAALGHITKEEDYTHQVGYSERTHVAIEPRVSVQWWCSMKQLAQPAIDAVENGEIAFHPAKYKNLYRHWMDNIKDWCISRQLWWGQRIPAYYDAEKTIYVAETYQGALAQYAQKKPALYAENPALQQDEDVLDTWFSSWLWPMEVFGWNKNPTNHDLAYYYPTQTLVTAPEIIFFWVARMIMAGYEFTGQKPFNEVYFTGIVRDKKGKKMSKSLGNSPDLLELIDEFGADAARFSVMFSSPAGNDLLFDKEAIVQGRNFCNKMWNALRLIKGWESRTTTAIDDDSSAFAIMWMREKVNATATEISVLMKDFKLSEALKVLYGLIWNDFCSWYLEWVKPAQDAPVSQEVYSETVSLYQYLLQLLHPFMPFITEDIYSKLDSRTAGDHLMVRQLPALTPVNNSVLTKGEKLQAIITGLRDGRNKNNLKPKYIIDIKVDSPQADFYKEMQALIEKQVNGTISGYGATNGDKGITVVVGADQLYITAEALQTTAPAQKDQLKKDLDYLKGFLESVERKLSNEKFINNAKPEVIALEQNKKTDALEKIAVLELALASLN